GVHIPPFKRSRHVHSCSARQRGFSLRLLVFCRRAGRRSRISSRNTRPGGDMRYEYRSLLVSVAALAATLTSVSAVADADLDQKMSDSSNWASQAGDNANHRYSELSQINAGNVGKMQVAWTMSTGVLRGHEGSPLVIGDTMFIHTPFPN